MTKSDRTVFFAAANTEGGFMSLFDTIFSPEELTRIFILKGGPGTGKSTLIKRVGNTAETLGYEAVYYACASDTDSLDGVVIPALSTAVIDGTAPHLTDPRYPGAVERIVNLGDAFDGKLLSERESILPLIRGKRDMMKRAYRYLSAAGSIQREETDHGAAAFLSEKAEAAVARLVGKLKHKRAGRMHRVFLSAIGTKGRVTLPTLHKRAERIYTVTDKYGLGYLFMEKLREALSREGIAATVVPSPLIPDRTEMLFVEGENALFVLCNEEEVAEDDKVIRIDRFLSRTVLAERRQKLRFSKRCADSLTEGALEALGEAGRLHAEAERIYVRHMDFSKVNAMGNAMISEIFKNNM